MDSEDRVQQEQHTPEAESINEPSLEKQALIGRPRLSSANTIALFLCIIVICIGGTVIFDSQPNAASSAFSLTRGSSPYMVVLGITAAAVILLVGIALYQRRLTKKFYSNTALGSQLSESRNNRIRRTILIVCVLLGTIGLMLELFSH